MLLLFEGLATAASVLRASIRFWWRACSGLSCACAVGFLTAVGTQDPGLERE